MLYSIYGASSFIRIDRYWLIFVFDIPITTQYIEDYMYEKEHCIYFNIFLY